jgi:threonine/homoserine/homoserine lactone efflux protein
VIARLLGLYAVYLAAAVSPGPAVVYVMRTAVGSRPLGLRAALGVSTATTIWVLTAALGLAAVLKGSPHASAAIRGAGGGYFL